MKITRQMFIDANIFTYLLTGHPIYGRNCQQLLEKVESGDLEAFISPLAEITIPLAYHPQRKFLAARFPAPFLAAAPPAIP